MNRNKIFKIVAGSLAGVALGGALIYYNFVDKDLAPTLSVGDTAPDFVVDTYQVVDGEFQTGGEDFQLSQQKKLTVINFWATWCPPCKAELPYFSQLQENYGEYVDVIALTYSDAGGEKGYKGLATWLSTNSEAEGWENFAFTFGYYDKNGNDVYYNYGFAAQGAWPSTAIVDTDGKVVYSRAGSLTYDELRDAIRPFLPDGTGNAPSTPVEPAVTPQKNWWKENALGVTFLAVSAAMLGAVIVVSAVSTTKDKKKKAK